MALCERQRACVAKYMRGTLSQSHCTGCVPPLTDVQRSHFSSSRGIPVAPQSQLLHQLRAVLSRHCNRTCLAFGFLRETRLTGESDRTPVLFFFSFLFWKRNLYFEVSGEKMLTENFHLAAAADPISPEINEALPLGIVLLNLLQSNAAFF